MSPICSIIVAKEIGIMVRQLLNSKAGSKFPLVNKENTVRLYSIGKPNQLDSATGVKSISPRTVAKRYDTMTPSRIGIIFTIPFPKILQKITTTMAVKASPQLLSQFSTADFDRFKPIAMIIGPVTTGGK